MDVDKRNFRKKILSVGLLLPLKSRHAPAPVVRRSCSVSTRAKTRR